MEAAEKREALRSMIVGDEAIDLNAMRRLCRELTSPGDAGPAGADLVASIELLDLALLHEMPESLVETLRGDALAGLRRLTGG